MSFHAYTTKFSSFSEFVSRDSAVVLSLPRIIQLLCQVCFARFSICAKFVLRDSVTMLSLDRGSALVSHKETIQNDETLDVTEQVSRQ